MCEWVNFDINSALAVDDSSASLSYTPLPLDAGNDSFFEMGMGLLFSSFPAWLTAYTV